MVMEGDEAGRRSRLTSKSGFRTGIKVSLCLAEHVQGASGPTRSGWDRRAALVWGRGPQTAKGPHTQGLCSVSSRLLDDKRRRRAFRRLTMLSSACQVPAGQKGRLRGPDLRPDADDVSSRAAPELGTEAGRTRATCNSCACAGHVAWETWVPPGAGDRSCPAGLGRHGAAAHRQRVTQDVPCFVSLP